VSLSLCLWVGMLDEVSLKLQTSAECRNEIVEELLMELFRYFEESFDRTSREVLREESNESCLMF
jgi:hypothetical protein